MKADKLNAKKLAGYIDHTILKADATLDDIKRLCSEAKEYGFASVCVNPSYVEAASKELGDSSVAVCTVVGFPLGATTPTQKALETAEAIALGADEVDMVINLGAVKSKDWDLVEKDIRSVVAAASEKTVVKVIIETCLLDDEEKARVCRIAKDAGADFVKTSTGFSNGGATADDVRLMRETVGPEMGVKASGGIHTADEAVTMIEAGATRIGTSSGVEIVQSFADNKKGGKK